MEKAIGKKKKNVLLTTTLWQCTPLPARQVLCEIAVFYVESELGCDIIYSIAAHKI
jgi:hypothetical protein